MLVDEIAALIVEPVVGEGGYTVPPVEFITGLRNVIRLMFPLVIEEDELSRGLDILESAIKEVNAEN